jgi:ketosteroid isomerase-like protein
MSRENIEVVRRAYDLDGDVDALLELCAGDIEIRDQPALPGSRVAVGHEGVRAWYAELVEGLHYMRFEPQEFIDAGDRVLVVTQATTRGKGSGVEVEMRFSSVWTIRDGKAVSLVSYDTHAEALHAAGLSANAYVLRRALDAFNRRDKAAWLELCDPELENHPPRNWPQSARAQGSEAVWDFLVEGQDVWEPGTYELVELVDAGDERVLAHQRGEMRGKASGAGVVFSYWLVVSFRDGMARRLDWFTDRADALAAAGLAA